MTDYKKLYKNDPELAEVMTAQEEFVAQQVAKGVDRAMANANPRGPLYVWSAHQRLADYGKAFEKGDTHALMVAIRVCANHNLPLPEWASRAYIAAFDKVNHYHAGSWDDVFGRPVPKGQRRSRLEFERRYGLSIFFDVLNAARSGVPRDDLLFSEVGERYKFGEKQKIGATRVKAIFGHYARMPHFKTMLPAPKPKRKRAARTK